LEPELINLRTFIVPLPQSQSIAFDSIFQFTLLQAFQTLLFHVKSLNCIEEFNHVNCTHVFTLLFTPSYHDTYTIYHVASYSIAEYRALPVIGFQAH
jgi:hypothetical protein